jgi:hypothetical protein
MRHCQFLTTKGRPTLHQDHSRQKPYQLPGRTLHLHHRYQHIKINVEQCPQHKRRKVHVPGIEFFYLSALLNRYEHMKIPLALFLDWIKKQCNLESLVLDGFVYLEMCCADWGLTQAGILANKILRKRLLPHGYYECANIPGLWKHSTCPMAFALVINNFGVKYVGKEDVDHLIQFPKTDYELTKD